ncbi:MAG TPA: response regulator, partial [Thermoanaerobaculia bacterium]|nr:response regulator [Thermoanaerobaculia bacterium]
MAKKILLADDSITIQKVVELTFSDGDYEIIAVNNGSKAIQKLQEIRPDIILSDIIMPEKNGYEVCEFVKSHPDFKTIPVILLTGTFEPFDPDRAERAGCDAVVTKPFESQSLIHKVDELIQQSTASAPSAPTAPPPNPFDETQSTHRTESASAPSAPSEDEPFAEPAPPSPEEIFGVGPSSAPAASADRSGSVFDETNPPGGPAPSFDEPPAFSGETTAFPKMSLEDLQRMSMEGASEAAPEPPAPPAEQPDASWSAATTAFPKMSFADLQKLRDEQAPAPTPVEPPTPEPLEWPRAAQPEEEAP